MESVGHTFDHLDLVVHPLEPAGEWADTGLFTYIDNAAELTRSDSAPGYAEDPHEHNVVGDDIWPCRQPCAAPQGHLCNFTIEEAGEMILQLITR